MVTLICRFVAYSARIVIDIHTYRQQNDYRNPRCACAQRVNEYCNPRCACAPRVNKSTKVQNPWRNTALYIYIYIIYDMVSMQYSHPFRGLVRGLVRQILLGFSLGSKYMFTRCTHFQPNWYNSLTLWAYLTRRHDQEHKKATHKLQTSSHKNGRLNHVNTVHAHQ